MAPLLPQHNIQLLPPRPRLPMLLYSLSVVSFILFSVLFSFSCYVRFCSTCPPSTVNMGDVIIQFMWRIHGSMTWSVNFLLSRYFLPVPILPYVRLSTHRLYFNSLVHNQSLLSKVALCSSLFLHGGLGALSGRSFPIAFPSNFYRIQSVLSGNALQCFLFSSGRNKCRYNHPLLVWLRRGKMEWGVEHSRRKSITRSLH